MGPVFRNEQDTMLKKVSSGVPGCSQVLAGSAYLGVFMLCDSQGLSPGIYCQDSTAN